MAASDTARPASAIPATPTASDYAAQGDRPLITALDDPLDLFSAWLEDAKANEISDANAMALATVDGDGLPDVRVVLLKDFGPQGFTFYTNYTSAKGTQLDQQGKAAVNFHWKSVARQVRIRGTIQRGKAEEADAYFASRARDSQLGAWASHQSQPLGQREALLARQAELATRYKDASPIPRPEHWGGYVLSPMQIEFWQDQAFRLHDRLVYRRKTADTPWAHTRLNP